MSKTPKNLQKQTFIYTLSDPDTLEIRYVGKTVKDIKYRLADHLYSVKREKNYRSNWIKSLLKQDKKPLIEIIDICSWNESQELEIYWISQFLTWGFNLTNLTIGGEGNLGRQVSELTKNKIRKANSKIIYQYDLDGNFIKEWESATQASKLFNVHHSKICACARGVKNSAYKYQWSYKKFKNIGKYERFKK